MTPFMLFLSERREKLRPMLKKPVPLRGALHKHPGVKGVVTAGMEILRVVPSVEIADLGQPAIGLAANALNAQPEHMRALQRAELEAAATARIDALAATKRRRI